MVLGAERFQGLGFRGFRIEGLGFRVMGVRRIGGVFLLFFVGGGGGIEP